MNAYNAENKSIKIQFVNTICNSAFNYDEDGKIEVAKFLYKKAQELENSISAFPNNGVLHIK